MCDVSTGLMGLGMGLNLGGSVLSYGSQSAAAEASQTNAEWASALSQSTAASTAILSSMAAQTVTDFNTWSAESSAAWNSEMALMVSQYNANTSRQSANTTRMLGSFESDMLRMQGDYALYKAEYEADQLEDDKAAVQAQAGYDRWLYEREYRQKVLEPARVAAAFGGVDVQSGSAAAVQTGLAGELGIDLYSMKLEEANTVRDINQTIQSTLLQGRMESWAYGAYASMKDFETEVVAQQYEWDADWTESWGKLESNYQTALGDMAVMQAEMEGSLSMLSAAWSGISGSQIYSSSASSPSYAGILSSAASSISTLGKLL